MVNTVDEQLAYEPTVATRNRKLLRPNPLATWELRIQNLRVFYHVEEGPPEFVLVVAVGIKIGNQVMIEGKHVKL